MIINFKYLKENSEVLDSQTNLSQLEKAIVSFYLREDYDQLMTVLEGYSDAEAFEIIRHILGEDKPLVEFNLFNEEFNVLNNKLDILLMNRTINHELNQETKEFLIDIGKVSIEFVLEIKNDLIFAVAKEKKQFKKNLSKALELVPKKVKSLMNWSNSKNMLAVAVLGLSLSACSKSVYKEEKMNLTPGNDGNIPSPTEDYQFIYKNIVFANHADPLSNDELYSKSIVENNSIYEFSRTINDFSFKNREKSPTSLHLFVQGEYFCSYILNNDIYEIHPTCSNEIVLIQGTHLEIKGIPGGETVSLKVKIK